jgi:hypothetical protein
MSKPTSVITKDVKTYKSTPPRRKHKTATQEPVPATLQAILNPVPNTTSQKQYVEAMRRTPRRHSVGGRSRRSGQTHTISSSVGRTTDYDDYTTNTTTSKQSSRQQDKAEHIVKSNNIISKGWTFEGNIQTSNLIFIGDADKILFNERRCSSIGKNLSEFMTKTQQQHHPIQIFGDSDGASIGFGGGQRQLKLFAKYGTDGECIEIRLSAQ